MMTDQWEELYKWLKQLTELIAEVPLLEEPGDVREPPLAAQCRKNLSTYVRELDRIMGVRFAPYLRELEHLYGEENNGKK